MNIQEKGQSLFEVVFALGIIALILVSIVSLSAGSVRTTTYSKNSVATTQLASQAMEWMRSERDTNWATFAARAASGGRTWCLSSLTWTLGSCSTTITNTIYTREAVLTSRDLVPTGTPDGVVDTVDAVVTIRWTDAQGTHSTQTNTRFTDWRR